MPTSPASKQKLHLESYKILVSMLQNDDNLFWRRNDILIAINGGMLTVIGLMQTSDTATSGAAKAISLAMCMIGIIVCILWLLIIRRGEAFYNHWYEQLIYLETKFLRPIRTFQIAEEFFAKGEITLGRRPLKLDRLSHAIRMFGAIQALAGIFALVWLFLGLYLLFY